MKDRFEIFSLRYKLYEYRVCFSGFLTLKSTPFLDVKNTPKIPPILMIYPLRGVKIPTFLRHFCVLKSPVLTFRILTPLTPGFGGGYPVYQK